MPKGTTTARGTLLVGTATVIEGTALNAPRACVFEDDETTGYFYAVDISDEAQPIKDAVLIYNVAQVEDRERPSIVQIVWSENDRACVLTINDYFHAAFDFEKKIGYARTGFPESGKAGDWSRRHWSDEALKLFD